MSKTADALLLRQAAATVRGYRLSGWEETAGALTRMADHLSGRTAPAQKVTEAQARAAGLRGYAAGIAEAIGTVHVATVAAVEELMRTEHRTLDHLDRTRFDALARECHAEIAAMSPADRALLFPGT